MQIKATIVALALAATSRVAAQDISDLPECAVTASLGAIGSTGCSATDIKCVCSDTSFLTSLQPAVAKACSPADIAKTAQIAQALCASVGVTLSLPAPGGASTSEAPASTAPGPVSVTSTSVATSTVVVGTGTGTGVPAPTTNGTVTAATPTPTTSIVPGAAANVGVQSGLVALAGAAAMFFAL